MLKKPSLIYFLAQSTGSKNDCSFYLVCECSSSHASFFGEDCKSMQSAYCTQPQTEHVFAELWKYLGYSWRDNTHRLKVGTGLFEDIQLDNQKVRTDTAWHGCLANIPKQSGHSLSPSRYLLQILSRTFPWVSVPTSVQHSHAYSIQDFTAFMSRAAVICQITRWLVAAGRTRGPSWRQTSSTWTIPLMAFDR